MKTKIVKIIICILLIVTMFYGFVFSPAEIIASAQQPTGSIPTVTGTPPGMIVSVNLDIETVEVYSGPSSYLYPAIGVILKGQEIPVFGISEDENWLQVYYPGVPGSVAWVYGPYVTIIRNGSLSRLESPPTPTPASTPTIDPTLAAAFIAPVTATRLPTFTAPAPLVIATFLDAESAVNRVPVGLLILGLGFIGGFGTLLSFLRGR